MDRNGYDKLSLAEAWEVLRQKGLYPIGGGSQENDGEGNNEGGEGGENNEGGEQNQGGEQNANSGGEQGGNSQAGGEKAKPKTVSMSQEAFDDLITTRINRALDADKKKRETDEQTKKGEFESLYLGLKKDVDEDLAPKLKDAEAEIEFWRKGAQGEVDALLKDLPDDVKELMPEEMSLPKQLAWLKKAAKVEAKGGSETRKGLNPKDPSRAKGGDAALDALKGELVSQGIDYRRI